MTRAFHPLLFAAFPVLFLFRENLWGLTPMDVVVPVVASIGSVAVLQAAIGRISGRPRKTAFLLTTLVLLFFTYGHVWRVASDESGRTNGVDTDLLVGTAFVILAALVSWRVVRARGSLADATKVMNFVAVAVVVTILAPLATTIARDFAIVGDTARGAAVAAPRTDVAASDGEHQRDIYSFVFDRYADAETLSGIGLDNMPFLRALERRGLVVAPEARANYQATNLSLAASLNMRYLDWAREEAGADSGSLRPIIDAIDDHAVGRFLRRQGYRYVHVGSRWDMTRDSSIADVNVRIDEVSEFTRVFLGSTALLPLMRRDIIGPAETDRWDFVRGSTLRQFAETRQAARFRSPKFVFAHFLVPHPPYVFMRDGGRTDQSYPTVRQRQHAYIEQVRYTNGQILKLLDTVMSGPPDRRPIVIVQADEGPYPSYGWKDISPWWAATDDELRTKFGILTAMHLPGAERKVPPGITPVNVFRLVLGSYFGADLPLLDDHSYVSYSPEDVYRFVEITDRID